MTSVGWSGCSNSSALTCASRTSGASTSAIAARSSVTTTASGVTSLEAASCPRRTTTRWSTAASTVSRSAWRTSPRRSGSPGSGATAIRSSPSGCAVARDSWSRPRRQTTRYGTERAGPNDVTVTPPPKKRPEPAAVPSASSTARRTSAKVTATPASEAPFAATRRSPSTRSTDSCCRSLISSKSKNASRTSCNQSSQPGRGRSVRTSSTSAARRATTSAHPPVVATPPPSTPWGSMPSSTGRSTSANATPSRSRSTARRQVFASRSSGRPKAARCAASIPQRTLRSSAQRARSATAPSSRPNRRRTGSRPQNATSSATSHGEASRCSSAPMARPTGLSVARPGCTTRCPRIGAETAPPGSPRAEASAPGAANVARTRGSKRSRSGHTTTMSSSVRVESSASRCRSASRKIST